MDNMLSRLHELSCRQPWETLMISMSGKSACSRFICRLLWSTLPAAGIAAAPVAAAGPAVHAQGIDSAISHSPFTFSLNALEPGGMATLLPLRSSAHISHTLCAPLVVCVQRTTSAYDAFGSIDQATALGSNDAYGTVASGGGSGTIQTHFGAPAIGTVWSQLDAYAVYTISPHTELTVGFDIDMAIDASFPAGVAHEATGDYRLQLYFWDGEVTSYTARISSALSDEAPDSLSHTGFLHLTNGRDYPMEVVLSSNAALATSVDAISSVPEPAGIGLWLAGLLGLGLKMRQGARRAGATRASQLRRVRAGVAGFGIALLAGALPSSAATQALDGNLRIGGTTIQFDDGPETVADLSYVSLGSAGRLPGMNEVGETFYRDTVPESFSHALAFGDSWTTQEYVDDANGGSAALHWQLAGEPAWEDYLSSSIFMMTDIWLQPGQHVTLRTPVEALVGATGVTEHYGLSAAVHAVLSVPQYGSAVDEARIDSIAGEPASLDDTLYVRVRNPFDYAVQTRFTLFGQAMADPPYIAPIPEPHAYAMLLVGGLLLVAVRGKRPAEKTGKIDGA